MRYESLGSPPSLKVMLVLQLDPAKLNSRGLVKLPGERSFANSTFGDGSITVAHKCDNLDTGGTSAHSPEGINLLRSHI